LNPDRGLRVRIRGIYATALSVLFVRHGFILSDPSPTVAARLDLATARDRPTGHTAGEDVAVADRRDRHGIVVRGLPHAVSAVVETLRGALPDAVVRPHAPRQRAAPWQQALQQLLATVEIELPGLSKDTLDALRAEVAPTVPGHHFFKTLSSERVDQAEALVAQGHDPAALAAALRQELIYSAYAPGASFTTCHVKISGGELPLRGRIQNFAGGLLTIERAFSPGGRYDTLDIPKLRGDSGTLELPEGGCVCRRTYRRASGEALGELYNISTPVELGPDAARYVDLEVDVARFPDGRVEVVDIDQLQARVQEGYITRALADRAVRLAERLAELLRDGTGSTRDLLGLRL
jgi:hypothetical protein